MNIRQGNVVSHTVEVGWGAGKVMEVTPLKATIQFNDGIIRKIASSHYTVLQPADPASFVPAHDTVPVPKVRATTKRLKKIKEVVA
jgi:hypothetical protein